MKSRIAISLATAFAMAMLAVAQREQTFTGVIADSMCERADHSHMQMGPTDAECTVACVREHGADYVLFDGKRVLTLVEKNSPEQQTLERFAGQKVTVTGRLDAKGTRIDVTAVVAAKK